MKIIFGIVMAALLFGFSVLGAACCQGNWLAGSAAFALLVAMLLLAADHMGRNP